MGTSPVCVVDLKAGRPTKSDSSYAVIMTQCCNAWNQRVLLMYFCRKLEVLNVSLAYDKPGPFFQSLKPVHDGCDVGCVEIRMKLLLEVRHIVKPMFSSPLRVAEIFSQALNPKP
jgi:hypothetical protein